MKYFISDTHFYHENIIKFDSRPFSSVEEMNQTLIDNWNKVVEKNDDVYILGDFCWKTASTEEYEKLVSALNGFKHLIAGNHDPKFSEVQKNKFWASYSDYKELVYDGKQLILCHYPIPFYKADYKESVWMLYGHVHVTHEAVAMEELTSKLAASPHSEAQNRGHLINVGCMMPYMNYTPQPLEVIIKAWEEKYGEV